VVGNTRCERGELRCKLNLKSEISAIFKMDNRKKNEPINQLKAKSDC